MVAQNIFFYAIAATMVGAGLVVVTSRNIVRAALGLIVVFGGVAAQFVILAAEFVAVTQVLIYVGAIMVLILFGIMLTRAKIGQDPEMSHERWWVGAIPALLLVGVMGYALIDYFGDDPLPGDRRVEAVNGSNTATVSDSMFAQYLVPFELISVLLLAALIGAIVIARKDR
ncbi:MAG TPA: NADH-quinone oxidoreductase subunit J [Acidimicrobiales bacterium]|jgi:NADH-quinone oxidoreductase subunit J|nr:NADH-quinone oxidoreductase subunit J [Acidimicrobiales bacterium]